jgi:chromosome segregation ATPase
MMKTPLQTRRTQVLTSERKWHNWERELKDMRRTIEMKGRKPVEWQGFEAAKQKLQDMTSSWNTMENLLHEAQVQLELKENEASQLKESKERLEKQNGGLRTRISRASRQKDKAVEKAVQNEQRKKAEFHVQEKGVVTKTSHAMMRDLVSLGVKAETVNAAVSCIAEHLSTTIEGKFTSRSTRRAVVEGGVASCMQIAEEMKSGEGEHRLS